MLLHARAPLLHDQMIEAELIENREEPALFLFTDDGLFLTFDGAMLDYEIVGASRDERETLARHGCQFGGVQ